ncbi:uroporphyrinogen decarboxylase [Helicobacter saguini]|uniref:Uroporphyrinogen decarboxylase n=1 Tax=Helicobacter saguini TaxID=1548018 RepID=A0A347VQL4_9HELI|nr:uroporphyrinogen decarboxylase [Helicobacter saguini]MWV60903.1 uroporphyrinogen decarboxylase [Helicobacter saguini]MWV68429.1 uroporphyrinogen decarboxylase [Helicobacter saguini]MWV70107.1 uroporphyrinogen decarboxylase [Helicobacter saguini]MWV72010.1 uroporphyrinogen decarboxylase [Helicobacter saguini]TLD93766.1 uroporphyrinogen decarboxylase [Helicobacter saguini]
MTFIKACFKEKTPYTPVWFMRQAGRYLDEYKATRAKAKNFLDLCQNVALSSEITLQPIEILDVDAAILFSDILVLPFEMGLPLEFKSGEGPVFSRTIENLDSIESLRQNAHKRLNYVYECVADIRAKLSKDKALIGFSGAPWTLATYMIEGAGSKAYEKSKKILYTQPRVLHALLERLSDEIKQYLSLQIKAGANAVMLFDSWANALEKEAYLAFGWAYLRDIAAFLKREFPKTPVIIFPRGTGVFLEALDGNFDVLGIDWQTPMSVAKAKVGDKFTLQGNLEPARIYNLDSMKKGALEILQVMQNKGHIFNLGHGMIKDLPRENAIELVKFVREESSKF